ncbi:dethiobiotin synthase [Ichthyenterobacterium sp. W332]|uniref:ATP-dependent dethiobiotin synthetase BioD n=1 Tax=Microcosmobacter mediterraneus TaxID=3075607 RepID=A0ABU2YI92_9FLAO|nr:dethiobiotin synthase [Ichthyenterobacterium sp. W332]MDT0557883.1 dethiobiotin synthase [Ichthyenterobacterium sp. W332]
MNTYFVTGIGTDVGKTIVSAIITEALEADYWKPVQAGDVDSGDKHRVKQLISNNKSVFYDNTYALKTPMSPHGAAEIDGITIDVDSIKKPKTKNNLVIEGAGGLLVPLNNTKTVLDLITKTDTVIVVSRHYLGSINHTLLTVEQLKQKGFKNIVILFNGNEHKSTEDIISKITKIPVLGRINDEPYFDKNVIKEYANLFKAKL